MFGSNNQASSGSNNWNSSSGFGGLFGNSGTNASGAAKPAVSGAGTGLFSQNTQNTQNTTQNTTQVNPSNNLFGGVKVQSVVPSADSNSLFTNVNSTAEMPPSITESIFKEKPDKIERRRPSSAGWLASSSGTSLLSKLAKTFNIFRTAEPRAESSDARRGIFSANNYPSTRVAPLPSNGVRGGRIEKKIGNLNKRHTSDVKKLIIKSKPLKFHLIDADKVINSKKRHITQALPGKQDREDESSDEEGSSLRMSSSDFASRRKVLSPDFNDSQIKVTEDGKYWTSPSIEEITGYTGVQLERVENFIIGRKGYGQIAFNTPVDLSRLQERANSESKPLEQELFEKTVEIGWKYVKVYKDDATKPQMGYELNVPATITLEKMLPEKNSTVVEYIKRLQQLKGMEFVTYDPITYVWVFKVQHFSVWGLVEDAEDNEVDQEEEKFYNEIKRQKLSNETKDFPGSWQDKTSDSILDIKRNLVSNEITSQLKKYDTFSGLELPASSFKFDESVGDRSNYEYLRQLVTMLPNNANLDQVVNEKAYEPEVPDSSAFDTIQPRPNIAISDDWLVQLKLSSDLNSALAKYLVSSKRPIESDNQLDMMQVDRLLFDRFENDESSKEVSTPSPPLVPEEAIESDEIESKDSVEAVLEFLLKTSTTAEGKVLIGETNFSDIADCCEKNSEIFELFALLSALFDTPVESDMSDLDNTNEYLRSLQQKQTFSRWLSRYNITTKETLLNSSQDVFEEILVYVTCGETKRAIEKAIETNNNHLSVLLTLCDTNYDGMRDAAKAQLDDWVSSSSIESIPTGVVNIYKLLAGELEEVLANMPWSIRLAAQVNFEDSSTPLSEIIDGVSSDFDEDNTIIEILSLFANQAKNGVETAVATFNASSVHAIYKWFVSSILPVETSDELHLQFGASLVGSGMWKEALFVYSLLNDKAVYEKTTRSLLTKTISQIFNPEKHIDERRTLRVKLRVPNELIYEAIAADKKRKHEYWDECDAWISATQWQQAHDCIVSHLGPTTVISKNKAQIERLQLIFKSFPDKTVISSWNQGAGVYEQYFEVAKYLGAPRVPESVSGGLDSLMVNVGLLSVADFQAKVALRLMTKDIGDLAVVSGKTSVLSLPLGENEKVYFTNRLQTI